MQPFLNAVGCCSTFVMDVTGNDTESVKLGAPSTASSLTGRPPDEECNFKDNAPGVTSMTHPANDAI